MSCTSPLVRFGGLPIEALPPDLQRHLAPRWKNGGAVLSRPVARDLQKIFPKYADFFIDIPCGKCLGCCLDYSRQWADRCFLESKLYEHNYFLTLTYDDAHLKYAYDVDEKSGEFFDRPTLDRSDLVNFIKRVRQAWRSRFDYVGIRVFYCGEYGDQTARPHYHIIFFNLPVDDLILDSRTETGWLFRSDLLSSLWPFGRLVIANVNWDTCAYVARYVVKKRKGPENVAHRSALETVVDDPDSRFVEPFVGMSRRPAIGKQTVINDMDRICQTGVVVVQHGEKSVSSHLPKFLRKFVESVRPLFLKFNVHRSKILKYQKKLQLSSQNLTEDDLFRRSERDLKEKFKNIPKKI